MAKVSNVRLALEVNGKPVCTSGVDGFGVLTTIVNWVKRDPSRLDPKAPQEDAEAFSREVLVVQASGLDSNVPQSHHRHWYKEALRVGDVVTIRILGPGEVSEIS
jgi:hypothetical protein